jgi:hypothetical protein
MDLACHHVVMSHGMMADEQHILWGTGSKREQSKKHHHQQQHDGLNAEGTVVVYS